MAEAAEARTAVAELMATAGIKRLICVDDAFAADEATFVATLAGLEPAQRAAVLDLPEEQMAQEDLWQELARTRWQEADDAGRSALADNAYAYEGGLTPVPQGSMRVLNDLVPDLDRETLTLTQWLERRETLIGELQATPTLILFDQDMSHESEGGPTSGQKLIAELESALAKHKPPVTDAFYGLLTNTVTAAEERDRRHEIISAGDVDPARFVLIAKENLQSDELSRFAMRLRTTLLAPIFADLMQQVLRARDAAIDDARSRASAIAPEDMERMVIRLSGREGVWPPDTLLRILEVMQRTAIRQTLRSEGRVVRLTERLRALAEIPSTAPAPTPNVVADEGADCPTTVKPTLKVGEAAAGEIIARDALRPAGDSVTNPTDEAAWTPVSIELAHQEIYESDTHINELHLPLELGDLFSRESGKTYVLIAQPCDLMVRSNGKRAPELSHCLLAEVGEGEAADAKKFASFELPYYDVASGASWYVRLGRPSVARLLILDACVINADGHARLETGGQPPTNLLSPWLERRGELLKVTATTLDRIKKVQGALAPDTRNAMCGQLKGDPFPVATVDLDAGVLTWDCRRVGRVCDPYARALLSRFSQYFSRDAYLFDFAREFESP